MALVCSMNLRRLSASAFAAAAMAALINLSTAEADWVTPVDGSGNPTGVAVPFVPSWAGGANTTAQTWTAMCPDSATIPTASAASAAQASSASAGVSAVTPVWYDASASSDGAFAAGTDVYSFSGVLTPTGVVPGFNLPGNQLNVVADVQYFGATIDPTLTANYTDPNGVPQSVSVALASANLDYANGAGVNTGFGISAQTVAVWAFTLPQDTSNLTLTWGWGATSSAIQDMAIYTQSVAAVPEPSSAILAAFGAAGLAAIFWRKRFAVRRNASGKRAVAPAM